MHPHSSLHYYFDFSDTLLEATKEVLILCGIAKRSDFDFEQEAWFQAD